MKRDQRRIRLREPMRRQDRDRIVQIQCELFQGTGELSGGVLLIRNLLRADDEVPHTGLTEIRPKDIVPVEKISDDLLKAAEIGYELRSELSALTEKARERRILDRSRGICIAAHLRKRDDVFVTEDLEMRGRKAFA